MPVIRQGDLSDEGASSLYQSLKREHTAGATERVRRNDPQITSEMGADPGYGMARAGLREEARHDPGMDLMRTNLNTERAAFGHDREPPPLPPDRPNGTRLGSMARMKARKGKQGAILQDAAKRILDMADQLPRAGTDQLARIAAEDYDDPGMLEPRTPHGAGVGESLISETELDPAPGEPACLPSVLA